ncbi:Molybdenum cofactor synthesis protein 1 [Mycoemilia scoparia]|uniref:GTP 3',8-cyclase n=1 Tax=Mycoemilia scoparia TaxID=417184 RepID=A0A9W8DQS3_9FUNG|nr:Molybdenum cofactor synthesis protein 1 [Mycoemilia scoparia]
MIHQRVYTNLSPLCRASLASSISSLPRHMRLAQRLLHKTHNVDGISCAARERIETVDNGDAGVIGSIGTTAQSERIQQQSKIEEVNKYKWGSHKQQTNTETTTEKSSVLTDLFGRTHNYLRISITERCNLRCTYCMPEEGIDLTPKPELLTADEIVRLARIFVSQGVDKIRLTGGEPTVRKDIVELISRLNELKQIGLRHITITTNGVALHRKLPALREAGLDSLNISLDTRDPTKFANFTRRNGYKQVMKSIEEAFRLDFDPVKLNVVVMRGQNEDEIPTFVEMTHDDPLDIRFIEYMPFDGNKWNQSKLVPYREILKNLHSIYGDNLTALPLEKNHTAKGWKIEGYKGQFGFITSMTNSFCYACNRVRLMADGNLKVCLFGNSEVNLRDWLRQDDTTDRQLMNIIEDAIKRKKKAHAGLDVLSELPNRPMIKIGG